MSKLFNFLDKLEIRLEAGSSEGFNLFVNEYYLWGNHCGGHDSTRPLKLGVCVKALYQNYKEAF